MDFFHNGCIEEPELKKAFELKKIKITEEEINNLFKIMDQNLKGAIDYTEFLMAGFDREQLFTNEKLTKAFNYFDINKSGFIEIEDLKEALLKMGKECTESDGINSIIHDAINNLNKTDEDNKSENLDKEFFDEDIKEEDNNDCKLSKKDFFQIFSIC